MAHPPGLRLIGEIDLSNVSTLSALLRREREAIPEGDLTLDLSGLAFIDSTGMRILVEVARDLHAEGRHLLVREVPSGIRRIFGLMGLDRAPGIVLLDAEADADSEAGIRRDKAGAPHPVAEARCACGCPYLYAADDLALFWEPGWRVGPECTDGACECHVSPLRG